MTTSPMLDPTAVARFRVLLDALDRLCAEQEITLDREAIDLEALASDPSSVCLAWQGTQVDEEGVFVEEVLRYAIFGQTASTRHADLPGEDLVLHFADTLDDAALKLVGLDDYHDPAICARWCIDLDTGAEMPFTIQRLVSFPRGGSQSDYCATVP